jgi:hypothetical protein
MKHEQLQAYAEISRAVRILDGTLDGIERRGQPAHHPGVAANLREAARLCMAAAHRLDPREEEGSGQIAAIHPET